MTLYSSQKKSIRGLYNRPFNDDEGNIVFTEPSLTQQQFAAEADLNNIVDRNFKFRDPAFQTKLMLAGKTVKPEVVYGDFLSTDDYHTISNKLKQTELQFASLPAKVRDRFHNDPAELLDFVANPANYDEGIELGIYPKNSKVEINESENSGYVFEPQPVEAGQEAVSASSSETSATSYT